MSEFADGQRSTYLDLFNMCLKMMNLDPEVAKYYELFRERQEALLYLHSLNPEADFPDELYLVDILQKHFCIEANDK